MRDIKFRAWQIERKEMYVVGSLNFRKKWTGANAINENDKIGDTIGMVYFDGLCDDFELMQFTGLHDKNGVEIFEGDILNICKDKYPDDDDNFRLVFFDYGYFQTKSAGSNYAQPLYHTISAIDYVVVGNAHQNPELIQ